MRVSLGGAPVISSAHPIAALLVTPALDGAGGATVELPPRTASVRLAGEGLRAVDLRADAALRTLDLRDAAPGVRLELVARGPVEAVRLPAGAGAAVDLVLPSAPSSLVVSGPLRSLSVSWPAGASSATARHVSFAARAGEVIDGAFLGGACAPRPTDVEAWAIVGGSLPRDAFGTSLGSLRDLRLVDCVAPDGLDLAGDLDHLDLVGVELPELWFRSATKVRVAPCGALRRVNGVARRLLLRGGGRVRELRIEGAAEIDLADVRAVSVHALGARRLVLSRCDGLGEIHAMCGPAAIVLGDHAGAPELRTAMLRERVRRPSAADVEHELASGTAAGRDAMVGWAKQARQPNEVETALRVLAAAVDVGFASAAAMWAARGELGRRVARSRASWDWPFPEGQSHAGYQADVSLWLRLLADDEALAAREAEVFVSEGSSTHVAALLFAATGDVDPCERDALLDLARRALESGAARGQRLDVAKHGRRGGVVHLSAEAIAPELARVDLALRALVENAGAPRARPVADAFARWLAARLPSLDGVRALGRLYAHGSNGAAAVIDTLSAASRARPDLAGEAGEAFRRAIARELLQPPQARRFVP